MPALPPIVDREAWEAQLQELRVREKAHTRAGDAIAADRRRLPMVEMDPSIPVVGPQGTVPFIDTFEGRSQLFASFHMWHTGLPAADQCEGCTFNSGHVLELGYLHQRDVTYAVFVEGPFPESDRYRQFMGWEMPWYSVPESSAEALLAGGHFGMKACYLRDGDRVFETYWTTARGCEVMGASYGMLDMTIYGRQETWEQSPEGWPQRFDSRDGSAFREVREDRDGRKPGRPTSQWSRVAAGRSDDLGSTETAGAAHPCH